VGEFSYKSYDPARKEIVLSDGEREFRLDANVSAGQNSNILFSRSKEYRQKIIGANKILEQTIKSSKKKETEKKKKRNLEWFENYHWFYSSEGFLVIAGKDAKSNERIVKRHLKDKDIYVHAEVYGAPSTIVKVEGNTSPTDKTLTEAGIFAVSFSRAWPAGVASSSAYWVLPSQVSKTPESGEYISTGSWIVRGKRNYMPNLPLRLQISMYSIKGGDIPMIHPVFEIKSQEKTVTIVPGEMKRSEAAKEISMKLGVEKEEIEKLLPPGGSKIED
jgi:predicted ribosome quality control (RQC) complex YloA/Tae2 family protein